MLFKREQINGTARSLQKRSPTPFQKEGAIFQQQSLHLFESYSRHTIRKALPSIWRSAASEPTQRCLMLGLQTAKGRSHLCLAIYIYTHTLFFIVSNVGARVAVICILGALGLQVLVFGPKFLGRHSGDHAAP